MTQRETETIHPVDTYVGSRVRLRRKLVGMSQSTLAEACGITFQQIQKYERGSNRVSASKLVEISAALQCSVGFFFEGAPGTLDETADERDINVELVRLAATPGVLVVAGAMARMGHTARMHITGLCAVLADAADEDEHEATQSARAA